MKPSSELKKLVLEIYKTMGSGDATPNIKRISQQDGTLMIGTDPDEWWFGHKRIAEVLTAQEKVLPGATIKGDPQAYAHGDVGWWADQATFVPADGTEIPFRITGVFEKEAGEWKCVQWHASFGIPNADVGLEDIELCHHHLSWTRTPLSECQLA